MATRSVRRLLRVKLVRELARDRIRSAALVGIAMLGGLLFVSSYGGHLNLRGSYDDTRSQLALADWTFVGGVLGAGAEEAATALPEVEVAEARVSVELPATILDGRPGWDEHGDAALTLRIHGAPRAINRLHLLEGRPPGAGEIVVEEHLASWHDITVGETVVLRPSSGERRLEVSGIAVSAEYLWVARNRQEMMPVPSEFGVGWVDVGSAEELSPSSQLLVELADGVEPDLGRRAVEQLLAERGDTVKRAFDEDHVLGVEILQLDVDGFKQMALVFPLFFLLVGAFIQATLLARTIDAQRPLIGTMRALGVGKRLIFAHYMGYAAWLGLVGGTLGAVIGALAAGAVTRSYAVELGIPFVNTHQHPSLILIGLAAPVAVGLVSAWGPARRAAALEPAESMRPPAPVASRLLQRSRRVGTRLPLPIRLGLRNVLRRPGRSVATASGVTAALVLVLVGSQVLASMQHAMDIQFREAQKYDLRVDLFVPLAAATLSGPIAPVADRLETSLTLPVRVEAGDASYDTILQGIAADGTLNRALTWDGTDVTPTGDNLVLSASVARQLGVEVGADVEVVFESPLPMVPGFRRKYRVEALADAALGNAAFLELGRAQADFGQRGRVNTLLASSPEGGRGALRRSMSELPGVARVQDMKAFRALVEQAVAASYAMLAVMLLFAVILASAILFNTATLAILERRRELATLRALGTQMRTIALMLTIENGLLATVGVAIGIPLSGQLVRIALGLWSSDLFDLPFVFGWASIGFATLGVMGVLLLAQFPALRSVRKMNLADSARTRE